MEIKQSEYGSGDSHLQLDFLPQSLAENAFACLADEVSFSKMTIKGYSVPRLVAIQGELIDGVLEPVYRHPADLQPELTAWTPTILKIKNALNDATGLNMNHVLIQLYRSGEDNISPHTDKTLDILRGTSIYTMSFGAKRTLILRSKIVKSGLSDVSEMIENASSKSNSAHEKVQRIPLPHNSLFTLGSQTNSQYLHSIKADKRMSTLKTPEELFCDGQRISLTFRCIATFYHRVLRVLSGQGAVKTSHPPNAECSSDRRQSSQNDIRAKNKYLRKDDREIGKVEERDKEMMKDEIEIEIETKIDKNDEKEVVLEAEVEVEAEAEAEAKLIDEEDDRDRLINAFGIENQESDFDWDRYYGKGFQTLSKTFKAGADRDDNLVSLLFGIEHPTHNTNSGGNSVQNSDLK